MQDGVLFSGAYAKQRRLVGSGDRRQTTRLILPRESRSRPKQSSEHGGGSSGGGGGGGRGGGGVVAAAAV